MKNIYLYTDESKVVPVNAIKAYRPAVLWVHSFLTSPLDGDEWPA